MKIKKRILGAILASAMTVSMAFTGWAYTEAPAADLGAFDLEGVTVEVNTTGKLLLLDFESAWAEGATIESRNPDILEAQVIKGENGLNVIQYAAKTVGSAELVIIERKGRAAVNMGHVYVVDESSAGAPGDTGNAETPNQEGGAAPGQAGNTGWVETDNVWKYQNADGSFKANEWVSDSGKWYYLGANGVMEANKWVSSGDKWYYVTADGSMAVNTQTPDGYQVDGDGVWIE